MQNYSLMHWSSILRRGKEVVNVAKPIVPTLVACFCFLYSSITFTCLVKMQSNIHTFWL